MEARNDAPLPNMEYMPHAAACNGGLAANMTRDVDEGTIEDGYARLEIEAAAIFEIRVKAIGYTHFAFLILAMKMYVCAVFFTSRLSAAER